MHNFTKSLCIVLLLILAFAGCKDDKEIEPKNALMHNGREFELSKGLLIDFGKYPSGESSQTLFLSSEGVIVREAAGHIDSIYGVGTGIYFKLVSATENGMDEGQYTFDNDFTIEATTFFDSYVVFNGDFATEEGEYYELKEGKLTAKKEGSNYIINIDCIERNGKHVTCYYKGPLTFYNEK
jgi:hypothetical protein